MGNGVVSIIAPSTTLSLKYPELAPWMTKMADWKTPDFCFLIFQVELRIIPEAAGQKAEEWEMEWCPLLHQVQHSLLSTQS